MYPYVASHKQHDLSHRRTVSGYQYDARYVYHVQCHDQGVVMNALEQNDAGAFVGLSCAS